MTDQKPKCPPCHGNCNQGRTCPNKSNPEEANFSSLVDFVVTLACIFFVAICAALFVGGCMQ